ncbi:MAG: hypothetical protein L6437_07235 [Kiritimatiellae bacterium]|nr:hypothetical protein [Verrucomicrobiota bacterium]MCG2660021.1 hypothetical protein [Kiritimatiellia bacterium]
MLVNRKGFISIAVLGLILCLSEDGFSRWLSGWEYRKAVTIDNTGNSNALTSFQISVTNDFISLIAQGKMKPGCADIRFVDSDDSTGPFHYFLGNVSFTDTIYHNKNKAQQ